MNIVKEFKKGGIVALLLLVASVLIAWVFELEHQPIPEGMPLGLVDHRLEEASGLVASVANSGLLWTINDSGNPPEVFLIDQHAKTKLVCTLSHVRNRDWEDIAIGAGPVKGKNYIYVADIGDNFAQYDFKFIYRFEEPKLTEENEKTITRFDTLVLRMPDGKRDAETILIDPFTNDLYLISKREDSVALYTTPYPFSHDTLTLHKVMTLPYKEIVAGSITRDGKEVLLKDYDRVYYWKRSTRESLPEVLTKKPVLLPYHREHQGEGIAWSPNGTEFYTLSEGTIVRPASLLVYKIKK